MKKIWRKEGEFKQVEPKSPVLSVSTSGANTPINFEVK